ncbi:glycosyltransferase family 4 protein [Vibrio cholerae]|uniref:glycosyltransferase family 4 protein n=1 Tax=Vibrio cholerae TaxID=666 RepID=UPI0020956D6E|nr:glycosyltransferase family 4 protein [Vibrio cholerae]MCO7071816.1 glycosyltransferase family 4 protein [Vibrio cholerae]
MFTIAISSNTSWYLYNFRRNTIKSLIENGMAVVAIAPKDAYSEKLAELGAKFIHIDIDQSGTNPINDFNTLLQFRKIFKENNIDVVLNFTPKNNIYGTFAAAMCKVKAINNVAGLGVLFINETLTSKIARALYKFSQRFANKIFFQNEEDRALFLNNKMAEFSKTERLPGSGVDLSRFIIKSAPEDGVIRFLLIARMLYDKGIGQYVEAARVLKKKYNHSVEFCLLGFLDVDNPSAVSRTEMEAWQQEGIIHYLGVSDSVEQEIAKADCMVLPSYYREGVPKSLLEGAAMGKPIITTDNVGCREVVDHGVNGFLCEPRSTSSLIEQMEKFIALPYAQKLEMGSNSRIKVENEFDEQIVIKKYLDAIENILQEK